MLYPPGSKSTIPVIAVTGTNGKTTTVRLIAHLFRLGENVVGFTTTDGTYLQNRMVLEGDMTGPFSANIILSNPTVDIAVLETARGGLLRAGLGFDEVDVGVVLNVSADHLGLRGINTLEQLADVKGVVAAVVRREGHAVLNADDPLVYAMRDRTPGDIVLFSTKPEGESEEFETHLLRNGIGARIENETFVIRRGRLKIPIAPVREVPLMLGGDMRHSLAPEAFLKPVLAELGASSPTRGLFLLDSDADQRWEEALAGWLSVARRQLPPGLLDPRRPASP